MLRFSIGFPNSGRARVWIYLSSKDLFYPMIVDVDRLEEYVMDRERIKMLVNSILNIFLDTEFMVKWIALHIPPRKSFPKLVFGRFETLGGPVFGECYFALIILEEEIELPMQIDVLGRLVTFGRSISVVCC